MKLVYLDNAATTTLSPHVRDTIYQYMKYSFGNPSSIYSIGREARVVIEKSRKKIADIFQTSASKIFFTSSATESINTAIFGAIHSWNIKTFITSPIEHPSVLHTLTFYQKIFHFQIQYVRLLNNGQVDVHSLENLLIANKPHSIGVILMHVNNELGNVSDIFQIGNLCKTYHAKFICDMVQSLGIYNIDFSKMPIDIATMSAHKCHGPKGIGLLYINTQKITPLLHGGNQERNMRAGTENLYAIVGFAEAIELAHQNINHNLQHFSILKNTLLSGLQQHLSNLIINTDIHQSSPKIINVGLPINSKTEMLLYHLDIENIYVSSGSACSSGSHVVSHVIQHLPHKIAQIPLRFSFSQENTLLEIDYTIQALIKILT
ncbi:MAG: cysteine desulfurase family protein [Chitinophagaceae bacterium]